MPCCRLLTFFKIKSFEKFFRNTIRVSNALDRDLGPNSVILFGKLPFPSHLGKYIIKIGKIGKISTNIYEIGKIKAIFGLGKTPI